MSPLVAVAAACLAVSPAADRILARDMARVFPGLAARAPETPLGYAPAPGSRRVFGAAELGRMGKQWNEEPAAAEICFERPAGPLDRSSLLRAMAGRLPDAAIEILDYSRTPAPDGILEFPLSGLRTAPGGALWRGAVVYGGNRRFPVWAKVRAVHSARRVVAAVKLKAGGPIRAEHLRIEPVEEAVWETCYAGAVEEAAGRIAKRDIAPGTALRREWLDVSPEVARGDTVRVEVRSGGARVEIEARAESAGVAGQTISLFNPVSKKRFQAVVEERGRVSVGVQ
jgi:flagella basal body P-ring formation protein FlgA